MITESNCILRAARLVRLAQRAVAKGNAARCRRLAEAAERLLSALKNPPAAYAAPTRAGSLGSKECDHG